MKLRPLFATLAILAVAVCPAHAALLDFYFTMNTTGGQVTGEIEGLQSSGSSTPTEIVIFSQPSGFSYPPESLIASGYTFYNNDETFTVTAGAITAADMALYKMIGTTGYQGYGFDVTDAGLGVSNTNGMTQDVNGTITSAFDTNGFAGVTYTPVPEPHHITMAFLLAGVGLLVVRKLHGRFPDHRFSLHSAKAAV